LYHLWGSHASEKSLAVIFIQFFSNSSDTFTVTDKNPCKIAFGDGFLLAATTLFYGICSKVQIPI